MQKQTRTNKRHSQCGLLASGLALIVSACAAPAAIPATPMAKAIILPTLTPAVGVPQPTATPLAIGAPTATVASQGKGGDIKAARSALQPIFVDGTNAFGFKLLNEVAASDAGKNIFISPASVSLALAMVYNGAKGGTAEDMARTLGVSGLSLNDANTAYNALQTLLRQADPTVTLDIANSLWARQGAGLNDDFLNRTQTFYQAQISELDFNQPDAAKTINQWVSDSTHGKITEIVDPPIDKDMLLFLINAIYFKGNWMGKFDPTATRPLPFTQSNGQSADTPMMFQAGKYAYFATPEFQAVRLPYGDGVFSMVVLLPAAGVSLEQLRTSLTSENWRAWSAQFQVTDGDISMPKFKLEYKQDLVGALGKLGMGSAFGNGADFTGMRAQPPSLSISEVKHKTYIDVNEEGTEAAAVTSAGMRTTSLRETKRFSMTIDHPFFFAIQDDQTSAVLFSGLIEKP